MLTDYEYIRIEKIDSKLKTNMYAIHNIKTGAVLGVIKWFGAWRQYCFFPNSLTIFSKGCLNDIESFLDNLKSSKQKK